MQYTGKPLTGIKTKVLSLVLHGLPTNRYVLIIWKHLFESIALLKPRNKTHVCKTWLFYKKVHCRSESV